MRSNRSDIAKPTTSYPRAWCATLAAVLVSSAPLPAFAQIQRVLGLDISAWQGSISQTTWNNLHNVENRQFIILRSSRGGTTGYYDQNDSDNSNGNNTLSQRYDDPYYIQNINRVVTAGMFAGSYHFSRPDIIASTPNSGGIANSGTDEADHFIQMAGPWMRPGYLVPVHDLEAGDGVRTDDEMAQYCLDFSSRIYAVMGIRPAVYINGNYAANILGTATASLRHQIAQPAPNLPTNAVPSVVAPAYPVLWSARWPNQADPNSIDVQNSEPKDTYSGIYGPWDDYGVTHPWKFWQYASTLRLNSYNNGGSNLDADCAHGGIEFLKDQLIPAVWMYDFSGNWSTLTNWNSGQTPIQPVAGAGQVAPVASGPLPTPRLPGAAGSGTTSGQNDTVILERPNTNIIVTLSTGTHNIRKLYMREALNITGGSLTVNYVPSADSTTNGAQFSGPVALSNGSFSVHTLQVDSNRVFTVSGGTLTFNTINLMPHSVAPAKILMGGDVTLAPLANATGVITKGSGSGSTGFVDLGGALRNFAVNNGTSEVDVSVDVPISNGSLTKSGPGTLRFTAANIYSNGTTLTAGTLLINNTNGSGTGTGGVVVSGGFLGGSGTISGPVIMTSGGTIAPGNPSALGTLTLNYPPSWTGATNFLRIDRNGGSPSSDQLALTTGSLFYGGSVLVVSNAGAVLTGGEVFTIFSAPTYSGAFSGTNVPALAGGLNWYLGRLAVDGTLRVNRRPAAGGFTVGNNPGHTVPIAITNLISAASDADGDTLSLAVFDAVTTNGITLSSDSNFIYYSNNVNVADQFRFVISDGRGGLATNVVQIIVGSITAPAIVSLNHSTEIIAGDNALFMVTATGTAPLSYQWRFNGLNIPGATNSSYTRPGAQTNHAGPYTVVVTNFAGAVTSAPAVLTVGFSLTVAHPEGGFLDAFPGQVIYMPGSNVTLTAYPDAGFKFIGWSGDATGSANPLVITMTTNLSISGSFGSDSTDLILDNTNSAVTYSGTWQAGSSSPDRYNDDYRFAVTASGGISNVTYRPNLGYAGLYNVYLWYPQGGNRATNAPWTVSGGSGTTTVLVDQTVNGGTWLPLATAMPFAVGTNGYVRLSNDSIQPGKVVMADAVRFVLLSPPQISANPQNLTVTQGSNSTFTVTATGIPAPAYQWLFNGTNLPGATIAAYTRSNAQPVHAGGYSVVVTNVAGSVTSSLAQLTVLVPPAGPIHIDSITLLPGQGIRLQGSGGPGDFAVDISDTLLGWTQLSTLSATGSVFQFTDTDLGQARRYYRVRSLNP